MLSKLKQFARAVLPRPVQDWLWGMRAAWRSPHGLTSILRRVLRSLRNIIVLKAFCDFVSYLILKIAIRLSRSISEKRLARGELRTLWGVTPILTLPLKAEADRRLGFRSSSLVYVTYIITSSFDINLQKLYVTTSRYGLLSAFQRLVLAWALLRYDVFHVFADRGVLDPKKALQIDPDELAIWRAAGKRVYVYAYGADVRTRDKTLALGRWNFCADCTEPGKYCICNDGAGESSMSKISNYANATVSLGDMLAYMPGAKHLNYWPIDVDRLKLAQPIRTDGALRIAHAPNHTHFKGSSYLETVIARLQARGERIECVKIQGVPNTQVLELFETCDLVADQFIGGAYGYTALEAMALGRPVLSFVRSQGLVDAPEECPIINTTPDTLEEVLMWALTNRIKLAAIGEQGRSYVQRWHSIDAVALRFGELYRETANFPDSVLKKITLQREAEIERRNSIPVTTGWEHPYRVGWRADVSCVSQTQTSL